MAHNIKMATDYEQFYRSNPNGLGNPTKEFVDFFDSQKARNLKVLDVGCGQGRDALFIARKGHAVTAVDQSSAGIKDIEQVVKSEQLNIATKVADIRNFNWSGAFDVIVVDRTLHMLKPEERIKVLSDLMQITQHQSYILIADERRNLPAFQDELDKSQWHWQSILSNKGFLFVQRA